MWILRCVYDINTRLISCYPNRLLHSPISVLASWWLVVPLVGFTGADTIGRSFTPPEFELLMATNGSNNPVTTPNATTAPTAAGASPPGGAALVPDDGWHPLRTIWGLMGYGRRGTLRRRHLFTLVFKLVLGIGQVSRLLPMPSWVHGHKPRFELDRCNSSSLCSIHTHQKSDTPRTIRMERL